MLPNIRSHQDYQDFVIQELKTHYVGGVLLIQDDDWLLIRKLWLVDLSRTSFG